MQTSFCFASAQHTPGSCATANSMLGTPTYALCRCDAKETSDCQTEWEYFSLHVLAVYCGNGGTGGKFATSCT
jgi:hypothetical protein